MWVRLGQIVPVPSSHAALEQSRWACCKLIVCINRLYMTNRVVFDAKKDVSSQRIPFLWLLKWVKTCCGLLPTNYSGDRDSWTGNKMTLILMFR